MDRRVKFSHEVARELTVCHAAPLCLCSGLALMFVNVIVISSPVEAGIVCEVRKTSHQPKIDFSNPLTRAPPRHAG